MSTALTKTCHKTFPKTSFTFKSFSSNCYHPESQLNAIVLATWNCSDKIALWVKIGKKLFMWVTQRSSKSNLPSIVTVNADASTSSVNKQHKMLESETVLVFGGKEASARIKTARMLISSLFMFNSIVWNSKQQNWKVFHRKNWSKQRCTHSQRW